MSSEVIPHPHPIPAMPPVAKPLTREEVDLLKDTVCKGATDHELKLFEKVCNRKQLDPFSRQIYAVRRWDATLKREVMTFQTAIDGFRLIAERTGRYQGQDGPYWCGLDGKWVDVWLDRNHPPLAAKVGVYRQGFVKPLYAVALFHEYVQLTKEGDVNSIWRKRPAGQLAKCCESLALRQAFPEELSGLYTGEEMGQADNPPDVSPPPPEERTAQPVAETEPVPDEVKVMWSGMTNIANMCAAFAKLKGWLMETMGPDAGEAEYYRILWKHGQVKHANELKKSQRLARLVSWKLWDALRQADALRGEPPQREPGEGE